MRNRLYIVLPDIGSARQIERELLLAKIEDRNMHFLAKRGTNLEDLPEATFFQKTDLVHGVEVGLVCGAIIGALFGFWWLYTPTLGPDIGMAKVLIGVLGGAFFGIWASGLIAVSTPNSRLRDFEKTLEEGHVLLMADVPRNRVEEIRQLIHSRYPRAEDRGLEPTIPAFP